MEPIQIMPIREEHSDGFFAALDAVARERLYLALLESPPFETVRENIASNIARGTPRFVAVQANRVVGWCDISPHPREGFRHASQLGMGVLKEFRRRGIGKGLLRATLAQVKEIGLQRVELEVYASNRAAVHLYEKEGFAVEGIKKRARFIDGRYDDIICMALFVR